MRKSQARHIQAKERPKIRRKKSVGALHISKDPQTMSEK